MDSAGAVSVIFHFQNVSLIVTRLQDNLIASQESRGRQTPVQMCSPSFNKILPVSHLLHKSTHTENIDFE